MAPPKKYASIEEFNALAGSVSDLVQLIKSGALSQPATPAAIAEEKAIVAASPNNYQVNTDWEDMAREIVGEALDHTELAYVKGGGQVFTLVIKPEHSNAPKDYLTRYKVDRRSKEIGSEGEAGAKQWCQLVSSNLKRPRPLNQN